MDSQNYNYGEPDVVLIISETKFPSHRELLAKNSPYFQAMFTHNFAEKNKEEIEIKDLEPETMGMLLSSIQLGKEVLEDLRCEQVLSLLQASSMLQFESLHKYCIEAITNRWLVPDTCLQIMAHADALNLTQLNYKARVMALWNFSTVKNNSQFLKLSIDELEDYLQDDGLNATCGELEVFEACFSWIQNADAVEREKSKWRALQCIRFSDVSLSNMRTVILCVSQLDDEEILSTFKCILKQILDTSKSSSSQLSEGFQSEEVIANSATKLPSLMDSFNPIKLGEESQSQSYGQKTNIKSMDSKEAVTDANNTPTGKASVLAVKYCCNPTKLTAESLFLKSKLNECTIKPINNKEAIAERARLFMSTPPRVLPLLPCVVGRCFHPQKPYLIGFKGNQLVPLLRLQKAEQTGSIEPNGYRVVVKGLDLYILGGEFLWGHSNWNTSVWRYNLWTESWSFETSLEHQCRHQSVCCLDDDIYVMGGFGKYRVIADCVNRYNTTSKQWTLCPPLPSPIYSAACCVFQGCVYVFGPQVWSYNPQRHNWITLASCSSMSFNSALRYGDCIYLTGTYSKELYKFDGKKLAFECVGSFQLNATNICLLRDMIFMFGVDLEEQHQVETYDIKANLFRVVHVQQAADENAVSWSSSYSIGSFALVDY